MTTNSNKRTIAQAIKEWKQQQKQANPKDLKEMNITRMRTWSDITRLKYKLLDTFKPTQTILINMELDNGFHIQMVVPVRNGHFEYMGGIYIIDHNLKYYNMSSKLWSLDYHQSLSFPVKRKINVNQLTDTIKEMDEIDVDEAINPKSLKGWLKSSVVQKVMEGAEMADVFKFLKTMAVLTAIGVAIILVIIVQQSGMLASLGI